MRDENGSGVREIRAWVRRGTAVGVGGGIFSVAGSALEALWGGSPFWWVLNTALSAALLWACAAASAYADELEQEERAKDRKAGLRVMGGAARSRALTGSHAAGPSSIRG